MGNPSLTVSIGQLDPLEGELISGDDSIEITVSTRPSAYQPEGKKTFRTTLNSVLAIYTKRTDNPNQVTAEQVNSFTVEQVTALLRDKLGVEGVAINAERLDGSTKEEIIAEARAGTTHNSENLGGLPAAAYVTGDNLIEVLEGMTQSFEDLTEAII